MLERPDLPVISVRGSFTFKPSVWRLELCFTRAAVPALLTAAQGCTTHAAPAFLLSLQLKHVPLFPGVNLFLVMAAVKTQQTEEVYVQ